jgi:putative NADPH-quinone reductase
MASIAIIDGHPDPDPARFCHAIAGAYADEASRAGHQVTRLQLSELPVQFLHSRSEWEGRAEANVAAWQSVIAAADHIVLIYPLWLGDMPAMVKAFFEQIFRPGFAIAHGEPGLFPGLLRGKSARVIVTMGMPALIYRWFFFAHSLRSLRRNILRFVGFKPVRETIIGNVDASAKAREQWLERIRELAQSAH